MKYTVIIEKGRESGFVAICPALRGCVAQGPTKARTLTNLRAAINDYVECLIEDGVPVPTEVGRDTVQLLVSTK